MTITKSLGAREQGAPSASILAVGGKQSLALGLGNGFSRKRPDLRITRTKIISQKFSVFWELLEDNRRQGICEMRQYLTPIVSKTIRQLDESCLCFL